MKPYVLKDDAWRISANKLTYILEEYVKIKDKEYTWRPYGYYQNIDQLLRSYSELAVRQSDKNLPEALRDAVMDLRRYKRDLDVSPENLEGS